jgi:release factor glutamine methyltransferase
VCRQASKISNPQQSAKKLAMFVGMIAKILYRQMLEQLQNLYNAHEATVITDRVFEKIAGIKKLDFVKDAALQVTIVEENNLQKALSALLLHQPVQYILGEAWFGHLNLWVNEHVLIPRPETEELVQWIVATQESAEEKSLSILDIGTGSGCIPIYLKQKLPTANITAIDISEAALNVAIENALSYQLAIIFLQLNFLDETTWLQLPKFDVIVSNPPYIPCKEKEEMDANVIGFEPHSALFVADNAPLIFYQKIALFAKEHLAENGIIFVEIHEDFAGATAKVFESIFETVVIKKDIFGKDRMISASRFH